jgi:hypothetical protein
MINDMFRFGRIDELEHVKNTLSITKTTTKKTA